MELYDTEKRRVMTEVQTAETSGITFPPLFRIIRLLKRKLISSNLRDEAKTKEKG